MLASLAGYLMAFILLKIALPRLRQSMLDQPNERSSHTIATPRGGGSVFVIVACGSSVIAWLSNQSSNVVLMPLALGPLAMVGWLDDRHGLRISTRYGAQLVTAVYLIYSSPIINSTIFNVSEKNLLWSIGIGALAIIWTTSTINMANFLDGLDGLLGGCMFIAIGAIAIKIGAPWTIWTLIGAIGGFLRLNWSPASVFMGDVGSTFLGAVFVGLALQAHNWQEMLGLYLLAFPMLADTSSCIFRRIMMGQNIFRPHRLHLYQRLNMAGWSHVDVAKLYVAGTGLLGAAMILLDWKSVVVLSSLELVVAIGLDRYVALPFKVAAKQTVGT